MRHFGVMKGVIFTKKAHSVSPPRDEERLLSDDLVLCLLTFSREAWSAFHTQSKTLAPTSGREMSVYHRGHSA